MQSKKAEKRRTLDRKQARNVKRSTRDKGAELLIGAFGLESERVLDRAMYPSGRG